MTVLPEADEAVDDLEHMNRPINVTSAAWRSLSADYVCELRRLIREQANNTVHLADEIARRMLRSGDL